VIAEPNFNASETRRLSDIDTDLTLPLTERYFLGGLGTYQLRGFKARSVGPRRSVLFRTSGGDGGLFTPLGRNQLTGVCSDVNFQGTSGPVNLFQGNGNGKCNNLDDRQIDDFDDLDETDVIGGSSFISLSGEYRFPIAESLGLVGILFFDMGNAFTEDDFLFDVTEWRFGTGVGVLWFSPFGPLEAFVGFPLDKLSVEDSITFEFSVGGSAL
jgi:outer membrane protein insertion porin family